MARIPLALACGPYDRTAALRDGSVVPAGVDLTYLSLVVEETFFRMARFQEFDVAEFSFGSYLASRRAPEHPFVALPVFPSRAFRHSGIYVNAKAGITSPADLVGRRVGVAEWQLTANVWIRGILAEHYGVALDAVEYRTGGLHEPGRHEKLPIGLPPGIRLSPIGAGETLSELLVRGEIDALYTPRTPRPFAEGRPEVTRLFSDAASEEAAYFRRTGIFPIMHVVVVRRDVYEQRRWIARSLYDSFVEAKHRAEEGMDETAALRYMLPWLHDEVRRTKGVLGEDYWPYGLTKNRAPLETFVAYAAAQGIAEPVAIEDLFAPETLEDVVV